MPKLRFISADGLSHDVEESWHQPPIYIRRALCYPLRGYRPGDCSPTQMARTRTYEFQEYRPEGVWVYREMEPDMTPHISSQGTDDQMLTVEEAAGMLRKGKRWIYRNAHKLPFVRRLSKRSMLVSKNSLERWLTTRAA